MAAAKLFIQIKDYFDQKKLTANENDLNFLINFDFFKYFHIQSTGELFSHKNVTNFKLPIIIKLKNACYF